MNIKEKIERAKQAIEFIATHDDESVEAITAALREVEAHARARVAATVERRLGKFMVRLQRYFARLVDAIRGR